MCVGCVSVLLQADRTPLNETYCKADAYQRQRLGARLEDSPKTK